MTDRFIEQVADIAGRTAKALEKVAGELEAQHGMVTQPGMLRTIAKTQRKLAVDCTTTTQPIEIDRYNLTKRLRKIMNECSEVAADLLARGKPGHNELAEAAELIRDALESQQVS